MRNRNEEWEEIIKELPEGWERKARELGALIRGRNIKTAEELFALLMTYIGNGVSVQTTSTMFKLGMGISLEKGAVHHRIKNSWRWLRWMAKEICESTGMAMPKPEFLGDKEVILVDATDEPVKGSKKSDYRLHYAFNLFQFSCRSLDVTTVKEGEKLTRYEIQAGDIFIADRIYSTMTGLEHISSAGGDYIVRFKSKAFNLYDAEGAKINLPDRFRGLSALEMTDVRCFYRLSNGEMKPLRIVAMKKDAAAIEESKRRMARKVSRKQEKAVQQDTVELNEYIVVATTLEYTNAQILELYRARWQIEQVFYRLKSLYGYDEIPCKNADTAQAWFYGKLLLSAICEKLIAQSDFSPAGDWSAAMRATFGSKPLV